ncbi:MAG TPA: exodeoxyribonuclease V subunit alpha [Polyangia bacterium]
MSDDALTPGGAARGLGGDPSGFPRELGARLGEYDVASEALLFAWELSGCATALTAPERRALTVLLAAVMVCVRQGSTRLPIAGPERSRYLEPLYRALGGSDLELGVALALLGDARLLPIAGAPGDYRPLILDGDWLYPQRMRAHEDRLVAALRLRIARPPFSAADQASHHSARAASDNSARAATDDSARAATDDSARAALEDVLARPALAKGRPVELSEEQRRAVEGALYAPLTVLSGGPGTGKTSIVSSLLRVFARLGVAPNEIALAAPTGKAAWRMREAIERSLGAIANPAPADRTLVCPESRTLHRLLGYSPSSDRFRHHENNRLAERVVIVDESSMIDLYLMDRLVRAVRDDARLILLGDADQLPSVEAGAVFRELGPCVPGAALFTRSYRMDPSDPAGRNILSVARRIKEGDQSELCSGDPERAIAVRSAAGELAFEKVELFEPSGATGMSDFVERWCAERIRGDRELDALGRKIFRRGSDGSFDEREHEELLRLFDHHERFRILCVTRGEQPTGAAHLNELVHRQIALSARARGDELPRGALHPGEPVLVQRNDYDRGLWNGDQGLILRVADGRRAPERMAVFSRAGELVLFQLDPLRPLLERAYATTVHKSQGSEHDHVALILPDEDLPLLTRELLYTAVTRSRRSVTLVGRPAVLASGVARAIRRYSGLADALGAAPPSAPPTAPAPKKKPSQLALF